jgi:hypothetical protein
MGLSAVPKSAFGVGAVVGTVVATGGFVAAGATVVAVAHADKMKLAMTTNASKVVSRFFTIVLLLIFNILDILLFRWIGRVGMGF